MVQQLAIWHLALWQCKVWHCKLAMIGCHQIGSKKQRCLRRRGPSEGGPMGRGGEGPGGCQRQPGAGKGGGAANGSRRSHKQGLPCPLVRAIPEKFSATTIKCNALSSSLLLPLWYLPPNHA